MQRSVAYQTTKIGSKKPESKTTLAIRALALGAAGVTFILIGVFGVLLSHL